LLELWRRPKDLLSARAWPAAMPRPCIQFADALAGRRLVCLQSRAVAFIDAVLVERLEAEMAPCLAPDE
jgi:hypothetical protein